MNKFSIIGRLVEDPKLVKLEDGKIVTNITVAVDKEYPDEQGNYGTDFLPITVWGSLAENISKKSKKGSLIHLEGFNGVKKIKENGYAKNITVPIINHYKHLSYKKEKIDDIDVEKNEEFEK